jgi:methyl-accepting chemotaxis protein
MKNMKVSMKLIVAFSIVLALTLAVGVVGIVGLLQMNAAAEDMYTNKSKPLGELTVAIEYFQRIRVQTRNAVIYTGDTAQLQTVDSDLNNRLNSFEGSMAIYTPTIATDEGKATAAEAMDLYNNTMRPGVLNVLARAKQNAPISELMGYLANTNAAAEQIATDLEHLVTLRMGVMESGNAQNQSLGNMLLYVIIGAIALAVAVGMILAFYISGLISKPLLVLSAFMKKAGTTGDITLTQADKDTIGTFGKAKDETGETITNAAAFVAHVNNVADMLATISDGDLTRDLRVLSESDTMGVSLRKMLENLNNMFGEIHVSTSQVSSGSKQIADGAQALAQGSTEQAAAVEQLSSSISEIADKTKENAAMADKAATLSESIRQNAEKGSNQMGQMTQAVKEINDASQAISKVIKTIDDIAFQTNILALNAAVEAARAGQHGKGFAVVAEEVRSLASKSAAAAKDTAELIENSMEKAGLGAKIAGETAASLGEIVSGINESSALVSDIAKSSEEQSLGIAQINKGIDQVAQVVQQNSATSEESAAAAEEMSSQSNMLEELIQQFKIKNDSVSRRSPALASPSRSPSRQIEFPEKSAYLPTGAGGYGKY